MKRIISFLLSLASVLCFCFVPVSTVVVSAADGFVSWSGYSSYLKGAGSEGNPFLISTPSDLAYFRKQVATDGGTITYYANNNTSTTALTKAAETSHYKLTNDIYYNDPNGDEWKSWTAAVQPTNGGNSVHTWSPPGLNDNNKALFDGYFNGNGYTIYGMYIVHESDNCVGFIGLSKKATIEDLTLAYGYVKGKNCVSAFVGRAMMGTNIINCTSRMRVAGEYAVGAFVGGNPKAASAPEAAIDVDTETTIPNFTVYGCVNKNSVYGKKWVGGIVGLITAGAARVSIDSCKNSGKVTATTAAGGGILGGTMTVDGYGHSNIYECSNSGTIAGGTESYTGGIVGCGRAVDIYYSVNTGAVTGTKYTGGISGGSGTADKLTNSKINFCTNKGAVTGTTYTGGIVGHAVSVAVRKSANIGTVIGTNAVGGIAGKSGDSADVRDTVVCDCVNTGSVSSSNGGVKVAGIVGLAECSGTISDNRMVTIRRCVNYASVGTGRAICYSDSTLKDSAGTGLYIYTVNASTCFGMSGTNTNFDGGTKVTSFCTSTVLNALNSNEAGTWMYGYPVPTLTGITVGNQGTSEYADLYSTLSLTATSAGIGLSVTLNTSTSLYRSFKSYAPSYGFIAIRSDAIEEPRELIAGKSGVININGSLSGTTQTGTFTGISASDYNVVYTVRPYVKLTVNGNAVYAYGKATSASYYTASNAALVQSLNQTAITTCEPSVYVLVGGTHAIEYSVDSPSPAYSVAFSSSDESVATVTNGNVKGIKAGTATVTVKIIGAYGTKRHTVAVTVLDDLTSEVYANSYAAMDNTLRYHTNELRLLKNNVDKNDGYCLTFNGTVFQIDSGHNNNESLQYLRKLREQFLADGLSSGKLSVNDYHRYLLSDKCRLKIVSLLTHWHSDHLGALRYKISVEPKIKVTFMMTHATPTNTAADGYSAYLTWFNETLNNVKNYSPDVTVMNVGWGSRIVRYFGASGSRVTASDADHPVSLTACGSSDWSKNSSVSGSETAWENCSSVWYLFEYAGKKLLFTGDTFPNDVGTTYTYGSLSGKTAVDYMLKTHSSVIGSDIYFLECNHHSREAYIENLFTATKPVITVGSVRYGLEKITLVSKAVTTSDFYLAGDGQNLFAINSAGSVTVEQGAPAYSLNTSGHAIRNYVSRRNYAYVTSKTVTTETVSATSVSLSSSTLTLEQGATAALVATVLPASSTSKIITWTISDGSVVAFDGDTVTAKAPGTATINIKSGGVSATCSVTVTGSRLALTGAAISTGLYTLSGGYFRGFAQGAASAAVKALFTQSVTLKDKTGADVSDDAVIGTGYAISNGWDTAYTVLSADVDGNGKRTVSDYLRIRRAVSGTFTLSGAYRQAADTDGDGELTGTDAQNVKLYFKGLKTF